MTRSARRACVTFVVAAAVASLAPVAAPAKDYSPESISFMFGRKYAFACLYTQLDKPAEAKQALRAADVFARVLGVPTPELPAKSAALKAMREKTIPDALQARKGAAARAAFSLGVAVTDAWFGSSIGADPAPAVAEVVRSAKAAGLAPAVYKAQLDAIRKRPTEAALKKLAADLEAHYRK